MVFDLYLCFCYEIIHFINTWFRSAFGSEYRTRAIITRQFFSERSVLRIRNCGVVKQDWSWIEGIWSLFLYILAKSKILDGIQNLVFFGTYPLPVHFIVSVLSLYTKFSHNIVQFQCWTEGLRSTAVAEDLGPTATVAEV